MEYAWKQWKIQLLGKAASKAADNGLHFSQLTPACTSNFQAHLKRRDKALKWLQWKSLMGSLHTYTPAQSLKLASKTLHPDWTLNGVIVYHELLPWEKFGSFMFLFSDF